MKSPLLITVMILFIACQQADRQPQHHADHTPIEIPKVQETSLIVLGIAQDAGAPQAGCQKSCCASKFVNPNPLDAVVSLGLIDPIKGYNYLFEATPDIAKQLRWLQLANPKKPKFPNGIFITHAHIGHYSGLQFLGKEGASSDRIPTYAMHRLNNYLKTNQPWKALYTNENISLDIPLDTTTYIPLSVSGMDVQAILVPHRDEFSETAGYHIMGPNKSALFIPDIDKWELWGQSIIDWIRNVDYAFLDATFYNGDELPGRDMSQIPHPFVVESMELFEGLSKEDKSKVYFIHLNHTNPLLDPKSAATKTVLDSGYNIARPLQVFPL